MKAIRRSWNAETEDWVECEPLFSSPIAFLNRFIKTNCDYNMIESPSIMGALCRTFTWFNESMPDRYVVMNATKKCTTARLFVHHKLRVEHIWYH